jgi:hypothetical protein
LWRSALPAAIDGYQARPRLRRPVLRQKAWVDRADRVKTRFSDHHFEAVGQAYRGFRRTEDKIAVARYRFRQAAKYVTLRVLIEIDQNVPAEDHVKGAKRRKNPQED